MHGILSIVVVLVLLGHVGLTRAQVRSVITNSTVMGGAERSRRKRTKCDHGVDLHGFTDIDVLAPLGIELNNEYTYYYGMNLVQ